MQFAEKGPVPMGTTSVMFVGAMQDFIRMMIISLVKYGGERWKASPVLTGGALRDFPALPALHII